jgi:hypothetical protein
MGTLYYAVNLETDEMYELGKGAWYILADPETGRIDTSNLGELASRVGMHWYDDKHSDPDEFDLKVARGLQALGTDLIILNDSYDVEGLQPGYFKQIGSRYEDD